jgi:hypothetical protein
LDAQAGSGRLFACNYSLHLFGLMPWAFSFVKTAETIVGVHRGTL